MKISTNHAFTLALVAMAGCGEVVAPTGDSPLAPLVESVSPDHGPFIGGIEVSLSGENFAAEGAEAPDVVVGGVQATDVTVADDGTLTFTLPPGIQEGATVEITVFNQNGFATLEDAFRYNELPIVISISPDTGRGAGGTNVTIIGRGFEDLEAGDPTVELAGVEPTSIVVVDDTTITATTAATTAPGFAPTDVVITNANGEARLDGGFRVTQQGLIAIERRGFQRIFYVDTTTGDATEISRASRTIKDCAMNSLGTMYGSARPDNVHQLLTFDPLTGSTTVIGNTAVGADTHSISSLTFVGATLYGFTGRCSGTCAAGERHLASISTTTGAITLIGPAIPPPAAGRSAGAIGEKVGDATKVFYVEEMNGFLYEIAVVGGARTAGPQMNGLGTASHGMTTVGGVTYVSGSRQLSLIYTMNTTTGALTEFSRIPSGGLGGLCPTPPTF